MAMRATDTHLKALQRRNNYLMAMYEEEKEALKQERQRRLLAEHQLQKMQQLEDDRRVCDGPSLLKRGISTQDLRNAPPNARKLPPSRSQSNLARANASHTTTSEIPIYKRYASGGADFNGMRPETPEPPDAPRRGISKKVDPIAALPLLGVDGGQISALTFTPRTMARDTRRSGFCRFTGKVIRLCNDQSSQ
uniref:Uncharacterized protein n=1 Tax=Parascaris univalens TaxID=6257 RepID=A0A915AJH8_PARUN